MQKWSGIGASEGVGIGRIVLKKDCEAAPYVCGSAAEEKEKFEIALKEAKAAIEFLKEKTRENLGDSHAAIFEAHLMMIEDPEYIGGIESKLGEGRDAVSAVSETTEMFAMIFKSMPDPYLSERAIDIEDIGRRLVGLLKGEKRFDPSDLTEAVVVAVDLTPSDTAGLSSQKVFGIVTEIGGATSHSAIIAKTLGIPAVMGIKHAVEEMTEGEIVIIDGQAGDVILAPDEATLAHYVEKKKAIEAYRETLSAYLNEATVTKDGKHIEVSANIAKPHEAKAAMDGGAEGIGLFRSEFIFMDRPDAPSEEEQFEAYKEALSLMDGRPVIIRTMDIGGDKQVPYLNMEKEENPFLGYRAVRYCLDHEDFFKTQLRALMRASIFGKLRIMVPMIATVDEVRRVKALLEEVKQGLRAEGIAFSSEVELGIMIEIPSAALKAHILAKEVDFFSIGTNDLTQYTLAVDRMNANLSALYNPMDPAVLRLIDMTIKSGHAAGIWVGMCGNASGNPKMIPILLGMGLDEFSVSPVSVTEVRKTIMNLSAAALENLAQEAIMAENVSAVEALVAGAMA